MDHCWSATMRPRILVGEISARKTGTWDEQIPTQNPLMALASALRLYIWQSPACDQHSHILRCGTDWASDEPDQATSLECLSASNVVRDKARCQGSQERATRHRRRDTTLFNIWRIVKVVRILLCADNRRHRRDICLMSISEGGPTEAKKAPADYLHF